MRLFHGGSLIAILLLAAASCPARAQNAAPPGLVGAWGLDSGCSEDVAIFRADGTVIDTGAAAGDQVASYAVAGDTVTLTQGSTTEHFAFAMNANAIAWSNGVDMVLKQRCADQTAFATQLGHPVSTASLYGQILALASQPLTYGSTKIGVISVDGHPGGKTGGYDEIVAHPEPDIAGKHSVLIYRIFPSVTAATDHASLDVQAPGNFLTLKRGLGDMSVATAKDLGPGGDTSGAAPGVINCVRFHPKGHDEVVITCLEQMPNARLVAGGEQHFALPANSKPEELGPARDLTETLDLTSLAIDQLRRFLADNPQ